MEDYKRGNHTVWDCKYNLVWTRKYRYSAGRGGKGALSRVAARDGALQRVAYPYIEKQKSPEPDYDFEVVYPGG